ncbi:tyrosine-type recombinase/integrase [Clostridium tyrobutyricum]|jgi:integrase/recombinase XerD|uniref:tyrosine-type recombinase/integrase n=1 Tax=Clostridium tyrobutyricum TaxID=1519 RepID=UPI0009B88E00|nr:tyrosine-type recombinase/integrase [Clostridium tyrobutyricum]
MATGCRVRTLANLRIKDLDFDNQLITYLWTKNRKQQIVPMSNTLKKYLLNICNIGKESQKIMYL